MHLTFHIRILVCSLLIFGAFAKEKQIKLEDIERDNLSNERSVKSVKQGNQYLPQPPPATPPKMQYGFVPIKPPQNYEQQQYQQKYVYTQSVQPESYPQAYTQQTEPQTFTYEQPEAYQGYQQQQQQYQQQYVQAQAQAQSVAPQPGIQYVLDNQIQQTSQPQKYYNEPQYVYLQQYSSASNNVQAVDDGKGNIQYVMYVPASYVKDSNYDSILQAYNNQPSYVQPDDTQFVYEPQVQTQSQPETQLKYTAQQQPKYTTVEYATQKPKYQKNPEIKQQPTSLLDSYVPSILQYQYYKQQQSGSLNAIKPGLKLSPIHVGKSDLVKNYRNTQHAASQLNYNVHHTYLPHGVKQ